jgi:hypothetical protein
MKSMLKKAQLKNATRGGSEAQGAKLVGIILEYGIGIITCGFGPQDRGFESLYSNKNKYVNYFIGERGGLQIRCPGMGCTGSTPVSHAKYGCSSEAEQWSPKPCVGISKFSIRANINE